MLKTKCFQVALLAIAAIGLGFAPAGDAMAGECRSDRSSQGHWQSRSYGTSYHYRSSSHSDYSRSRVNASYRNDNVRLSVSIGSGRSYGRSYDYCQPTYRQPTYHRSVQSCNTTTVVYQAPPPSGYWKQVYHSPVYETRYRSCGTPYRVCVREGYSERVWVSTSYHY